MTERNKCFNCGARTLGSVSRQSPPKYTRYICREQKCWDAWYDLIAKGVSK